MQNETLKKINGLLKMFNGTFEIEANLVKEGDETIAAGLKIEGLKNDGSSFISEFYETFNSIVQSISTEHEVIFDDEKGLVIARKVIETKYIIDDLE